MKKTISVVSFVIIYMISDNHGECKVPDDVLRDLARFFLPRILEMYQSEEGKKQLEAWKVEQAESCDKSEKVNSTQINQLDA